MLLFYPIVIIVSASVIALTLWLKISEIRTGKPGFLAKISSRFDPFFGSASAGLKTALSHINASNGLKFLKLFAENLFHLFGTAGVFVSKYYGKLMNRVRGRRSMKSGGVVSFFLKNISESKEDNKKGQ